MQALIWEVLARAGASPARARRLLRAQSVLVTYGEAREQLALARRRNGLRLIFPV